MYLNDSLDNCGIRELSEIQSATPLQIMNWMVKVFQKPEGGGRYDWDRPQRAGGHRHRRGAYILFSSTYNEGTGRADSGQELAEFIKEHKLGEIVEAPVARNTNSGNDIQAWLWVYDVDAVLEWAEKRKKATAAKRKKKTVGLKKKTKKKKVTKKKTRRATIRM